MKRFSNRLTRCALALAAFCCCWLQAEAATVDDLLALSYTNAPGQVLPYRLWVPKPLDPTRRYPVILFLHGAGERGNDNRAPLGGTPDPLSFLAKEYQATWPCFFIAPQCPSALTWAALNQGDAFADPDGTGDFTANPAWPLVAAMNVIGGLSTNSIYAASVDTNRFLITGLSMGGYGTWDAISRWPGMFQSAVPICGGGDPNRAGVIGSTRVWAFHAADDGTVPVVRSRQMIDALRRQGTLPRFTEYPASLGIGHGSWRPAYADPAVVPWMFSEPDTDIGLGVLAEYFSNTNLAGTPALRRLERSLDHEWGTASPGGSLPVNKFSARFTSMLRVTQAGDYTFSAAADDQVTLWVDDQLILSPFRIMSNAVSVALTLATGDHSFRSEYVEDTANAYLRLAWGLGSEVRPIPQSVLLAPVGRVAAPQFMLTPGQYSSNVTVALSSSTPDAVIRFTRDGTAPTATSLLYTKPLSIIEPTLVRALALKPGALESVAVAADYLVIPYFVSQPKGVGAAVGSNATLSVIASGIGFLRYQWSFNGVEISDATNAILTLVQVQLDQSGFYDVRVADDLGSQRSQSAQLVVAIRPSVVVQPFDLTALQGETVILSIAATGSTPLSFRWRRGSSTVVNQILSTNVSRLVLTNLSFLNAGNYSVVVTNFGGAAPTSSNAVLTVLADSDRDGMSDPWETQMGFDPLDPTDADLDSDRDGLSNRAEFIAGTDATNRDDALRLEITPLDSVPSALAFSFLAISNRFYQITQRAVVGGGDWQVLVDFSVGKTNRLIQHTHVPGTDSSQFYRLGVRLHP